MKPIYKFALITIAVLIIGVLGYFVWQWLQPHEPEVPTGTFPAAGEGGETATTTVPQAAYELKKLSDDGISVFDILLDEDGNPLYIASDGAVYEPKQGPDAGIAGEKFTALNFTLPSPDNRYVLLAHGDPKLPQWLAFDTADRVWRHFSAPMYAATWKDAATLVAVLPGENNTRILAVVPVKDNFSSSKPVYTLISRNFPLLDVSLSWSETLNTLIIQERNSSTYTPKTWQFDVKNGVLALLDTGSRGELSAWLRGGYLLQYAPPANFLVLRHALTLALQPLFATIPGKCDISGTSLFCFAPTTFPLSPFTDTFIEDYYQGSVKTADEFYAADIVSGAQSRFFVSGSEDIPQLDATNVRAASTSTLYFVNKYDGGLYELRVR